MELRTKSSFEAVTTEGGLLPPDLLLRVARLDRSLPGLLPSDFSPDGERIQDAITRSFQAMRDAYARFRKRLASGTFADSAAGITREFLGRLFTELGYGILEKADPSQLVLDGKLYPISHRWRDVPLHLVGWMTPLDERTKLPPAASASKDGPAIALASPHGLVQEYLNRSDAHLWAIVSNGRRVRLLRDNARLTRPAYVEFDLERIFDGEIYSDFALLWLVLHATRLAVHKTGEDAASAPEPILERWSRVSRADGTRVLDELREGVQKAVESLGGGFLRHRANAALRAKLRSGELKNLDYYRRLLRLVYRMIFVFVAEDRDVLLLPESSALPGARERYLRWYSTRRLRALAERRRSGHHGDLWQMVRLVHEKLDETGSPELALPALGAFLWSEAAIEPLGSCDLGNEDFLDAIHHLAFVVENGVRRAVNWRDIGPEELGGIYESLLEQHPELHLDAGTFELRTEAGSERKTTGSYYTPESLVQCLLESALDPVLDEAAHATDPAAAILALKVCDPACGSGHFLIAAAHRIAKRLARVRTGDTEPAPDELRKALREVVGRCIYGVDVNEMAVELCKVNLWLEALDPGRPLSFLEHHIQQGNALIGATPALIVGGIPDDAFEVIAGDDKDVARGLKRQNKDEQKSRGQRTLFSQFASDAPSPNRELLAFVSQIENAADDTLDAVRKKESLFARLRGSEAYEAARLVADAFCAAFVIEKAKTKDPLTDGVFRDIVREPARTSPRLRTEIARLREQYGFLHWHVAFPDVFDVSDDGRSWDGGFDCVLGNPPWERVKLQEKEFFASRSAEIANAANAAKRRALIGELSESADGLALLEEFHAASRAAEGASHFVRNSGRFPLCGRGDINTYSSFAETMRLLASPTGMVGSIIPSGIAFDVTTSQFFSELVSSRQIRTLYTFENEEFVFPGIHHSTNFCLLTLDKNMSSTRPADYVFRVRSTGSLSNPDVHIDLSAEEIALVNPNTKTCPVFRSVRDADITKAIYRRVPVLVRKDDPNGNPWGVTFATLFHMSNDSEFFRTRADLLDKNAPGGPWTLKGNVFVSESSTNMRYLPLYEAKMIHQFTHRWGDYLDKVGQSAHTELPEVSLERLEDPSFVVTPRYWVPENEVASWKSAANQRDWLFAWRRSSRGTDQRTFIGTVIPAVGVGDSLFLLSSTTRSASVLVGLMASYVFDYIVRQKLGGTNNSFYIVEQLPVMLPQVFDRTAAWSQACETRVWLERRVCELSYTENTLMNFARDLGYTGPPFRWNPERRFLLRCELDAAFFHLYGIARDDVSYILETFPIVRRHDEKDHGEYRTKRVILEIYDRMAAAIAGGTPFDTILDPPPADPRAAHREDCLNGCRCGEHVPPRTTRPVRECWDDL